MSKSSNTNTSVTTGATIINLTPHDVTLVGENGEIIAVYPSRGVARARQYAEHVGEVNGIETVRMFYGNTDGLPEFSLDTYYIVSIIVANAAKDEGRSIADLLITSDPVRDEQGRIVGCKRFAIL